MNIARACSNVLSYGLWEGGNEGSRGSKCTVTCHAHLNVLVTLGSNDVVADGDPVLVTDRGATYAYAVFVHTQWNSSSDLAHLPFWAVMISGNNLRSDIVVAQQHREAQS